MSNEENTFESSAKDQPLDANDLPSNRGGRRSKVPKSTLNEHSQPETPEQPKEKKEIAADNINRNCIKPVRGIINNVLSVSEKEKEELFIYLREIEIQLKSYISLGPVKEEIKEEIITHAQAFLKGAIAVNEKPIENYNKSILEIIDNILLLSQKFAYMHLQKPGEISEEELEKHEKIILKIPKEKKLELLKHTGEKLNEINELIIKLKEENSSFIQLFISDIEKETINLFTNSQ